MTHKPALQEVDSIDEEYLLTADLDDLVWSVEPLPDNQECLCMHKIPRPATPTPQLNQVEMPAIPPLQPDQIEMLPEMELDIPEGTPDHTYIP